MDRLAELIILINVLKDRLQSMLSNISHNFKTLTDSNIASFIEYYADYQATQSQMLYYIKEYEALNQ